jgi:predicted Zn-dependent protease
VEKIDKKIVSSLLKKPACCFFLLSVFFNCNHANAIAVISDGEAETFLHKTIIPIFKAANTSFNPNRIYIINDKSLNAFVTDGNNMFIHTGTITAADSQNEISGILAHETGHIEGGHLLRHKIMTQEVQNITLASMILGGIAGIAAGRADMSIAAILGSQGSAINNMLTYQVSEERSADESAIKLLTAINQSPAGMLNFMKKIQQRNKMEGIEEFSYYRTHPVTDERIAFLAKATEESTAPANGPNEDEFLRVKAKIFAFIEEPSATFIKYPPNDKSLPARYAHAIAYFKQMEISKTLSIINGLIQEEPENPYFYELKGQMLLETGKVEEAVNIYKKTLSLHPDSSLFKMNLARAMLENDPNESELKYIVNILNQVVIYNPDSFAWLYLARTYGLLDDPANYNYASAEYSLRMRNTGLAKRQAEIALKSNPNSTLRLKIEDLLIRIKEIEKDAPPARRQK